MITPIILCGGSGTRLWPLSRSSYPKQFVDLGNKHTLFKDTIERVSKIDGVSDTPIVVTNEAHLFYARNNLRDLGKKGIIIVEPMPKNTAPAIGMAAFQALTSDKDAVLLVLPSDHVLKHDDNFMQAVTESVRLANDSYLVTFGIKPTTPETGYGYIKAGRPVGNNSFVVDSFVEKPNLEKAEKMVSSGEYAWNSGMFVFRADAYLSELEKYAPDIYDAIRIAYSQCEQQDSTVTFKKELFQAVPNNSVDYALMEKAEKVAVIPITTDWNDLGSWLSFYESGAKDKNENVLVGDTLCLDTNNSYIRSNSRLVATVGIDNLAVIETQDAVLVAPLDKSQQVKELVNDLKKRNRPEANLHNKVYRPWGTYESLAKGSSFQVKRIIVQPGEELSLQLHYHRAEHWIIVEGTAEVQIGDKIAKYTQNQSTYIPIGEIHRMRNPGKIPLVVIEVQSGQYLGEDDIVRFEDKYHRV
jgi:mannose-1-phosphate guanylyltransferase/mannose-6-phosphate isomerase